MRALDHLCCRLQHWKFEEIIQCSCLNFLAVPFHQETTTPPRNKPELNNCQRAFVLMGNDEFAEPQTSTPSLRSQVTGHPEHSHKNTGACKVQGIGSMRMRQTIFPLKSKPFVKFRCNEYHSNDAAPEF
jgi:hypothetical protein